MGGTATPTKPKNNAKPTPKAKPAPTPPPKVKAKASVKAAAKPTKPEARTNKVAARHPALPSKDVLGRASDMFKKIGDPTRLAILLLLKHGNKNVSEICEAVGQSQPAVSHHLALLLHSRVVAKERKGKNNIYRLASEALSAQISNVETLAKV